MRFFISVIGNVDTILADSINDILDIHYVSILLDYISSTKGRLTYIIVSQEHQCNHYSCHSGYSYPFVIEYPLTTIDQPTNDPAMEKTMSKIKLIAILVSLTAILVACSPKTETVAETTAQIPVEVAAAPTGEILEAAPEETEAEQPVRITGAIEISNAMIAEIYFYQRFVMLEDLTGFVKRDYEYEQPLEAQILGPVMISEEGEFNFSLNLPAQPIYPFNDVDHDNEDDRGVQIMQIVMNANYIDDPFLGKDETSGWNPEYTSARIDSENKDEIFGGVILVWSPDDQQGFPTSFGEDGLLFTEDDPTGSIPAGYTLVNLDQQPFEFYKEEQADLTLYEGELTVNDLSAMGWSEGFEALHNQISIEYPFTEMKGIDWDAIHDEFAPRVADAEADNDETAYYLALRDYSWSIPDGHVGLSDSPIASEIFDQETAGGFGFAIIGLDDRRVIAHIVSEEGPAAEAGMLWGAEILQWNGVPILDAIAEVLPWSLPFSSETSLRVQQYRYLLRTPVGAEVEVTFQNPGADAPTTVVLKSIAERETFTATSIFAGFDSNYLPVEYAILPNGFGYIKISSLSDDISLIIRLWEWAIQRMIANEAPAIIVDLRQNSGGSPLGTYFASFFVQERLDISRSYYYSEKSGEFETFGPPDYTEPDDKLYYDGQLAVLVSPACASACENVAYVLGELPQTRVFGFYPTDGIFGEVARGQYLLPGGYSFQVPTGMTLDMGGNIVIEGTGVAPDVRVPLNEETVHAEYVDGRDVVLDFALEVLSHPLGAGVTPEHSPRIGSKSKSETAFQAETDWLDMLARETYEESELAQAGRTYIFTIPLNTSRDLMWVYAWCTADEEHFTDNWAKIELIFTLNGAVIPIEDFAELEGVFGGNHCRAYYALLNDWAVGEHILTTTVTFTEPLNDGIASEDFPAGAHVFEYHVYVAR